MNKDPQIKERAFECPHCHMMVHLLVKTELVGLQKYSEEDARTLNDYSPELKDLLGEIKASGLIEVFGKIVNYVQGDQSPKDMARFFVTFARAVVMRKIPRFALDIIREEFLPAGQFQFWQASGVGVIVVDNTIRGFVPVQYVLGQIAKDVTGLERSITVPASPQTLAEWFKTSPGKLTAEQWVAFVYIRKACT